MNLLETLQRLLRKVGCITTLLSFSRLITEARREDLTGKETLSLTMNAQNKLSKTGTG